MNHPILVRQNGIDRPVLDWSRSTDDHLTNGEDDAHKHQNRDGWLTDFLGVASGKLDLAKQTGLKVVMEGTNRYNRI